MPSVLGLLEAREKKVREEVARLQEEAEQVRVALVEAESRLARLADARVTVAEVLAEPPAVVAEPVAGAVTRSVVPRWVEGMTASVLPPDYRRIMSVLESEADRGVRCQQLASHSPGPSGGPGEGRGAAVEGEAPGGTGWALEVRPGMFTSSGTPAG